MSRLKPISAPRTASLLVFVAGLTSQFAQSFAADRCSQTLDFTGGTVSATHLSQAPRKDHVLEIVLRKAKFDAATLKELEKFPNLIHVDLQETSIVDDDLAAIARLPTLEAVTLNDTAITNRAFAHLVPLKQLRSFSANSTRLSDVVDDSMRAVLLRIKHLQLIDTDTGDTVAAELAKSKILTHLSIGRTLTNSGVKLLFEPGAPQLIEFECYESRIDDDCMKFIQQAQCLRSLKLSGLGLTDACLKNIEGMQSLSQLALRWTRIDGHGFRGWKRPVELTHLGLSGSPISDESAGHLAKLTDLHWLSLDQTNVSDVGARVLLQGLPNRTRLNLASSRVSREIKEEALRRR